MPCWDRRWPMSADTLEMLFREFRLPTMAAVLPSSCRMPRLRTGAIVSSCCNCAKPRRPIDANANGSGYCASLDCRQARRWAIRKAQLPAKVRRQLPTLLEGAFLDRAENVLVFGLPGRGKTHFLGALGRELVLRHARSVYFTPTFKLVQQLLAAKRDLQLDALLAGWTGMRRSFWTTSVTSSNRGRRWKCFLRSWPSATSGAAFW